MSGKINTKKLGLIFVFALVMTSALAQREDFCGTYSCPPYTVIESTEDYELREYEATTWVAASDESSTSWFMDLFRYITGSNEKGQYIAMTVPVIRQYSIDGTNLVAQYLAFYMDVSSPPEPSGSSMAILNVPDRRVYVRKYGGFSDESKILENLEVLLNAIPGGRNIDGSHVYFAGYDAPFTMFNRHNEIWVVEN